MNSKTIIDFFKVQSTNVSCPACGLSLPKCKLNFHLDSDCPSSSSSHKEKDGISSEISPCSSKTSKPVNIKLKSKKSSKSPRSSKRSPKMNKLGRLSLKQQRIKNSNKITSVIDSLKCLKETEVITLDEDSSSSVDNVTEKLQVRNINVSFSLEQTNVKSTSAVTVHTESSPCTEASAKLSNVAEINYSHQSVYQKEVEEKVSSNGSKNPSGIAHDIAETNNLHQSMYQKEVEEKVSSNGSKNPSGIAHDIAETNNLHQSMYQKEVEEKVSSNGSKNPSGIAHDIAETNNLHQSMYQKEVEEKASLNGSNTSVEVTHDVTKSIINDISNKSGTENESKSKPVCDVSIATSQNNADELQSLGETNIDIDVENVLKDAEDCLEADDNVFTQNSETSEQTEKYSPYYIANFKHILNTVLNDDYNKVLFNEEDMDYVKAFETSSEAAQKLYVRLFQRKCKWLRLSKISYPNITQDPEKPLNELVSAGLIDLGLDKIDLDTALNLLSFPEAKMVAKHFKLSGKNKTDINQMLLKHCKQHRSVFFCNGKNTISNMVLKKIKDVLGPCYRLSLLPKRLFTRILMLFSLPTMSEDDDDAAGGQQQQLLTLLQVNKGEIIFPNYKINRHLRIFVERDELIRYEEAKQLENDIMNAVETKNFELAKELYLNARDEFDDQLLQPFVERPASLPTFLKKYSSFHIYVRCMTAGVDILQRLRQYKEAVELLKRLLDQKVFCQDYRGRWWDRMALNLEQHLKQPQQALEAIKEVIKDKNVRVGYRYSLLTRALRILKSVDEKDELKKEILEAVNVVEAPKVVIRGRLFPRNILGRRHVFISSSNVTDEDDITVLGVEQLAIEHYKNEGFTEGIHGEGSTFHALYGLLFWDIIYDGDIPDAFISPYQTHPLDLNHESFFIRREQQILNHLETLRASSIEEIKDIVKTSWEAHFGQASLVAWDHFTDVEHILGLVACMGNNLLCGICERLARDFRFTRSGVPDLVVWNPETLQVKIVEVKGPGDKLSSKQILWLDYLLKLGAQAEVCLVEAVGSKKLRRE